jgi:HEAT repeat protein
VSLREPLVLALVGVLLAAVALVVLIVVLRVVRTGRERRRARQVAPYRADLLAVSAAEDPDGAHLARLVSVGGDGRRAVDEALTRLLGKVRGAPAEQIAQVLEAHGAIERALADLHHRSPVRRARAAQLLGLCRVERALPQLVEALRDHAPDVRAGAAHALGLLGDPDAAPPVLTTVGAQRGIPAGSAADSLEGMGIGIANPLRDALDDRSATTRTVAAFLSGEGSFTRSTAGLHRLLADDPDLTVRETAATALGQLGLGSEVEVLARHTRADQPTPLRRACATALGALGDPAAVPCLRDLLEDPDPRLAELAAHALVQLGPSGALALDSAAGKDAAADVSGGSAAVATARTIAALREGRR